MATDTQNKLILEKMSNQEPLSKPEICRICLSSFDVNVPRFQIQNCTALKNNSERFDMLSRVFDAISVFICSDSGEDKICESCDNQLLTVVQFLEMCKKSEECLARHITQPELIIKVEKTEDNEFDQPLVGLSKPGFESIKREKTHTCHLCQKTFFSARQMASHLTKKHPNLETNSLSRKPIENDEKFEESQLLSCDFCTQQFSSKNRLSKHLQKHILVPLSCYCGKAFKSKELFRKHQQSVHADKNYKCPECEKSFRVKTSLISHENFHRGTKPFLCTSCPSSFYSLAALLVHQRRLHSTCPIINKKGPRFLCDTCGSSFARKYHLQRHVQHVHTKNLPLSFICKQCNKAFTSKDRLKHHMGIHNPRIFACPDCDKSFQTRYKLKFHIGRVHLELRPYSCLTCTKSFKVKCHLEKHLRTHTGEKPHHCPICSYKCAEKSNLQKHLRVHDRKN